VEGQGVCVGKPVAGITVHVVRITDEAIPEWDASLVLPGGNVGEFVVRGPVVTKAYFHRDAATRLAKIRDPNTGEILHRMGDVGSIDEKGRLWFGGRKSHQVEVEPATDTSLFTDMVEPIFNTVPGVRRTALVALKRSDRTVAGLCVERDGTRPWAEVDGDLRAIRERYVHTRFVAVFLDYPWSFPVDVRHNSKIFREMLAVWADKQLGPHWTGPSA
jgi:acyl-CoA synthetase (AMP-forming)/AMP-acid ligase II